MSYQKLPGVYFAEEIASVSVATTKVPLFIIESSTALAAIDDQVISFNNLATFKATLSNSAFEDIVAFVEEALNEAGLQNNRFYVYKNTAGTAASFTDIVVDTCNIDEIQDIIYLEGTKGTGNNTINAKIGALKTGLATAYQNGVNRVAYVVPKATVDSDVAGASSGTDEANAITSLTTIVNGIGSGRIAVIVPDYAGAMVGRVLAADYNEEIGYAPINTAISNPTYKFSYAEMVTIQNLGVMFVRGERIRGSTVYRVNLGVSTAFSGNGADGLLISRRVADELLRQVKDACDDFVKAPNDIEEGLLGLQTDIDNVIARFVDNREVFEDETELVVTEGTSVYDFQVAGQIKPIKSTIAINVNTTIA